MQWDNICGEIVWLEKCVEYVPKNCPRRNNIQRICADFHVGLQVSKCSIYDLWQSG